MPEIDLYKQIEELESENRLLLAENKRLREVLGLPLENIVSEKFNNQLFHNQIQPEIMQIQASGRVWHRNDSGLHR